MPVQMINSCLDLVHLNNKLKKKKESNYMALSSNSLLTYNYEAQYRLHVYCTCMQYEHELYIEGKDYYRLNDITQCGTQPGVT